MTIKYLFADFCDSATHAAKELGTDRMAIPEHLHSPKAWWQVLIEQVINSAIVAGIAAFAAQSVDVAWKAAALTFLIEMRKYRISRKG